MALALPASAAGTDPKPYTGALDGHEAQVNLDAFDPVAWTRKRAAEAPLRLAYKSAGAKETAAWQKRLRAKVVELLGGFPPERPPVSAQKLEERDFGRYRRQKFVFESRPGVAVLAYVLTPAGNSGNLPALIAIPGHGRGVDDIVGVTAEGKDRTDHSGYQHDFALQVVEAGMCAVAIEPMAFGCRRDATTKKKGLGASACQPAAGAALLLGETMIGWRVFDVMRTIDWLSSVPGIDSSRIGCLGISGGGTVTTFAAALDTRIQAAMVSGYMNTFRDSIVSLSHCIDNYVPGILNWAEMHDVAGLIAPRPLFIESGDSDPIFPVDAARSAFEKLKPVWAALGAQDKVQQEVFAGDHFFHGKAGIPFLRSQLIG